jgi:DNA-binding response OmpR family regulator
VSVSVISSRDYRRPFPLKAHFFTVGQQMTNETDVAQLRALIVDDEPSLRRLTMTALTREGFICDEAANGAAGRERALAVAYDLVITDLCMPEKHGHSLAVELLAMPNRPLVVVLTGVAEPWLTKDLITRGVDDVQFKPVNFPAFAAKVRSMVDRRLAQLGPRLEVGAAV